MTTHNQIELRSYLEFQQRELVVGRFRSEDGNFFAVAAKSLDGEPMKEPHLVILTPCVDDVSHPYLCNPISPPNVLGLGCDWKVDVKVDRATPKFGDRDSCDRRAILILSGTEFFFDLREKDNVFVILTDGGLVTRLPEPSRIAVFSEFSLVTAEVRRDSEIATLFSWPADDEKLTVA